MECLVSSTLKGPTFIAPSLIKKIVQYVLQQERRDGSVSVHLIADTKMRRLQRQYRGKHGTTDVLSFSAQEGEWAGKSSNDLGDIFISIPRIKKQAREWGVSFKEECIRMLIHGVLHILGYDHIKPAEAKLMFAKQEKYLNHWL